MDLLKDSKLLYAGEHYRHELYIDWEKGTAELNELHESQNGIPVHVWHKRAETYNLPVCLVKYDLDNLLDELKPEIEKVHVGFDTEWDGSNHVGTFTADAAEAKELITEMIERRQWIECGVWRAEEWLNPVRRDLPVMADSTDDQLQALAVEIEREAAGDYYVITGTYNYLTNLRDNLAE